MDWKRVKNILIVLLLATNLILAFSVYRQFTERNRAERQAVRAAVELVSGGLLLSESDVAALPREIYSLRVTRGNALEDAFAQKLLGADFESESGGGGIYRYRGQDGSGEIKRGGEIGFALTAPEGKEPAAHFAELLRGAGLDLGAAAQTGAGLAFSQSRDGLPILNYRLECTPDGVSGHWLISDAWVRLERAPSRAELVIRLAALARERGIEAVTAISCGYYVENTGGQDSLALPVWLVEAGGATLVFDLIGGRIIE